MARLTLLALLCAATLAPTDAADWPQWRGPQRNGISLETGWLSQWSASGPKRLWTVEVGEGYSSVAVVGGRVYTMGNAGNQDTVYCIHADSGQTIWRRSYVHPARHYSFDPTPTGPCSTPTVDGNNVYILSREGHAVCLNAMTGQVVWQNDLRQQTGAELPQWGFAGSPLVEGDLLIFNVGAAGAALDKATGRLVWKTGGGPSGYASPIAYTFGQQRGVAIFTMNSIVGFEPTTGRLLWQHPWSTPYDVNAADPILSGDTVFISSNYNRGCALLRVGGSGRPAVVWENRNMRNHFNSCVLVGDSLYGNDQNTLKCLDVKTGEVRWQQRGMGNGGLIAADGKLIVLTERGELVIIQATPHQYTELGRAKVMGGICWTHPVLANGHIYCRNREGQLVCLDVRSSK